MNPRTATSEPPASRQPAREPPAAEQHWSREQLFDRGDHYFDALIADIDRARHSIELEVYIFDNDIVGQRIERALIAARQRNVQVRVLIDGIGSYHSSLYHTQRLREHGIEVRVYHPLPWQWKLYPHSLRQGRTLDKALYFLSRINRRDHRKLYLIDHTRLWSGSLNLSAVHLPVEQGGQGWRDYGICVEGELVPSLVEQFDAFWHRHKLLPARRLFRYYWTNFSTRARRHKNRQLVKTILSARQRVWIISAYFAPSSPVIQAMKKVAKRGVDVRVIVPSRSDVQLFPILTATYYVDLLRAGVDIYEYLPSVLHAKLLIADELVILGSTNFNHRSYLHDLELDIVLSHTDSKARLQAWFEEDQRQSRMVRLADRHHWRQAWGLGWLSRLLRYWL